MCTMKLNYSENLTYMFRVFFPVANFDFLPTEDLYEVIFSLSQQNDEPWSDNFDIIGYSSKLVYSNLGSISIYQIVFPLLLGIIHIVLKFAPENFKHNRVGSYLMKLNASFWWNG